jgi:type I restriction enzyme S subunit
MIISKVNTKLIYKHNNRFEGKHYLNNSSYLSLQLENNEKQCCALSSLAEVFNPPVFKRQFCKNTPRAVPYFQSSDVQAASERSTVYIYKGQAQSLNLLVKENDILVTGFGTIGNTRLVSKFQNGACYANNVCRIRTTEHTGFIYAFISGKYGKAQLNTNASGSVVRYIESPGIKKILVPIFPDTFQQEVDDLIQKSARLREEASDALEYAIGYFDTLFLMPFKESCLGKVSSKEILTSINKRFEAFFHISEGKDIDKYIKEHYEWKSLGEVCSNISRPDIFKRYYVKKGITFLGGADIFLATPDSEKRLSSKKTANIEALMIKEGTILLPRSGTIGNVAWAHAGHAQKLASEDVIRITPNDILRAGYVYAFLASKYGKKLIQRYIFGSVIQHVEPPHLKLIPVPIIDKKVMDDIHDKVMVYSSAMGKAIEYERKAITMVEQEIEKWNKH